MNIQVTFPKGTPERHKILFYSRFKKFKYNFSETKKASFLIATPYIYTSHEAMNNFLIRANEYITIFDAFAEAIFPDFNIFDYGIGTDHLDFEGRMIYCPLRMEKFLNLNSARNLSFHAERKFCNFVYSNPKAHPMRDRFFHALCQYRKVDSLGRHLNNTEGDGLRCGDSSGENWLFSSIQLKSHYKFTIAFENAYYHGYTSEKLPISFMANSVPIYWGNPDIEREYNAASFINCHRFKTVEDVVDYIRFLDQNETEYLRTLAALPRTPEQENRYIDLYNRSQNQIKDLFRQALKYGPRKGIGTWPDLYREAGLNFSKSLRYSGLTPFVKKVISRIKNKKYHL